MSRPTCLREAMLSFNSTSAPSSRNSDSESSEDVYTTDPSSSSSTYGWDQISTAAGLMATTWPRADLPSTRTQDTSQPFATTRPTSSPTRPVNGLAGAKADSPSSAPVAAKGGAVRGAPFRGSSIIGGGVFAVLVGLM
ncbi:MAG: hypothetical protein M1816_008075 [Peltula sp. TS41687]|nr:MAG: hypothetical protein M1816_008075 [Peltula sp. TS41687]